MERKNFTQDEYEKADGVSLVGLAESLGYTFEKIGSHRLRVKEMDSMEIDPQRNQFFRHSQQAGGGPVQFLQSARNISVVEAVQRLCGTEYEDNNIRLSAAPPKENKVHRPFALPERAPHHRHVFAYLSRGRKIAPEIISELMHQKRLYETVFSHNSRDYYNCVFVGMNGENPVHAAVRFAREAEGKKPWRIVGNSDHLHPFAMAGSGDTLCVYESAIDAMSGATLDLMAGKDWRRDHRLDLNGLSVRPLEQYLEEHPAIRRIVLCLDNDLESVRKGEVNHGQKQADNITAQFRPLGYVVERLVTREKDMNQALKQFVTMQNAKSLDENDQKEESEWVNEQ